MEQDGTGDPWSVTEKDLREQMRSSRLSGEPAAVATIAAVEGTAYRRPGAKMLVSTGEDNFGAVTAGCLEDPVVEFATEVLDRGTPRLETFDLTDDDGTWGLGLGCNGVIDLFLEPLDASWDRPLTELAARRPVTVLTVVESDHGPLPVGSRVVLGDDGTSRGVAARKSVPDGVTDALDTAVQQIHGTSQTQTARAVVDGTPVTVMVDGLEPVTDLLLVGSQNDLRPLVRLAAQVGFRVTVHSPRGAVDESTFPEADTVTTGHPSSIPDSVEADERTYAVVMTHNLVDDRFALETLLEETDVPYVGLMGPCDRFGEIRDELDRNGTSLTKSELDRVSTPVGLDLGGGEPAEVALSVVSEVLAVSNGRGGGRLQDRNGPIHTRLIDE
jgi:xanthine dehydrogenase accessory factor